MRKKIYAFISLMMILMLAACSSTDFKIPIDIGELNDKLNIDTIQEQVDNPEVGQLLSEYMSDQEIEIRYFVLNPYYTCLDELTDGNVLHLMYNTKIVAYWGENKFPYPHDEVAIIQTPFNYYNVYVTAAEAVEIIEGCEIEDITTIPSDLTTFFAEYATAIVEDGIVYAPESSYYPGYYEDQGNYGDQGYYGDQGNYEGDGYWEPTQTPESEKDQQSQAIATVLTVGKKLEQQIDIESYNRVAKEIEDTFDYDRELKGILPFEIYTVDIDSKLYHLPSINDYFTAMVPASFVTGELGSIMVVKMDNADTFDLIVRMPYKMYDGDCRYSDLGNYTVVATNLTKEEVEQMVDCNQKLYPEYAYLAESYIYGDEFNEYLEYANKDINGLTREELIDKLGYKCSTGIPGKVNPRVIEYMLTLSAEPDQVDFEVDELIDASGFEDCNDENMIWLLSIINDQIGGNLLEKGDIWTKEQVYDMLGVESLPITDMVAIVDQEEVMYCIVARIHNETAEIEKENAPYVNHTFFEYIKRQQETITDSERNAKAFSIGAYTAGPYVWIISLSDIQGITDYMEAYWYHYDEYKVIENRIHFFFDYLKITHDADKMYGFDTSNNHWNHITSLD